MCYRAPPVNYIAISVVEVIAGGFVWHAKVKTKYELHDAKYQETWIGTKFYQSSKADGYVLLFFIE